MVVRIKVSGLEAIGATKDRLKGVLVGAIFDLDDALKRRSPVALKDGGTFRNSWSAQADGSPTPREGEPGPRSDNPGDMATIAKGLGGTISLVNSAVYAGRLARGHSKQAPDGWVSAAANELQDYIDQHIIQSRDS